MDIAVGLKIAGRGDAFLREVDEDDGDVFDSHPQLRSIWSGSLLEMAREGFVEFGRCVGGRFLIERGGAVVGITGYYAAPEETSTLRLRWHGLVPEARGSGLSGDAMRTAAELGRARFPKARLLVESMPAGEAGAKIARHFESLGFSPRGAPEPGGSTGFDWQAWSVELSDFLRAAPNPGVVPSRAARRLGGP